MSKLRVHLLGVLVLLTGLLTTAGAQPASALPDDLWFDPAAAATLTVQNGRFTDGLGREVVLRGYNVSGETKLKENNGLPFASVADAKKSATALRALGGGNSVRFLLSWAYAEPTRGQVDSAYLAAATDQIRAFVDAGSACTPTSTRTSTPAGCSTRTAGTPATAPPSGPSTSVNTPTSTAASARSGARTSPPTRP